MPAFRALLRAVEARFYHAVELPEPILDVGCGDGHFAQMTFQRPVQAGVDPWWNPLRKARDTGMYGLPLQAMGDQLPFPDHRFASAFSNSVLEHIPEVQPVLNEIGRVLQPGAPFVITVPSHHFTEFLSGGQVLEGLGAQGLAENYRRFFNRISRHAHTDPPPVWAERLAQAGFAIERWQYYFSPAALRALELGHIQGLPSAVLHGLTGHWILGPWESNLQWTERWVRPYYEEDFPDEGAYLFFLARRQTTEVATALLPVPRPFTRAELAVAANEDRPLAGEPGALTSAEPVPAEASEQAGILPAAAEPPPAPRRRDNLLRVLLVVVALALALAGQAAWRATPAQPAAGAIWFLLSGLVLLTLLWRPREQRGRGLAHLRWPNWRGVPRRRWLFLVAPVLAGLAFRFGQPGSGLHPAWPLIAWVAAAIVASYALNDSPQKGAQPEDNRGHHCTRFDLLVSLLLFTGALIVRLVELGTHPFILNGTEAALALDALSVQSGAVRSPFATGWLTNPTLPLFALALPLNLLGPSVWAVRLLSPFVGALTVVATYLIGQRLYGRAVALIAGILLLGSHFHLHFSRLGLTNAWDGLLILLALGYFAMAWSSGPESNRASWLWTGLWVGLNAYLYTSSHLLPLMLLALLSLLLLFDRVGWQQQRRNFLAMLALALVIALPQMLYYQAHPGIFMERANALGILASQSGWLTAEAARTGETEVAILGRQSWQAALAFNATLDTGTAYGAPAPLLNFISGALFILGLLLAALRFREVRHSILLVWIGVTIAFAGALLQNPPSSHRYIAAAPAASLLAAIALAELARLLLTRWDGEEAEEPEPRPLLRRYPAVTAAVVIALLLAVYDVGFYFGPYRTTHRFGDRNTEIAMLMAQYLNTLDENWTAYFYGPPSMYVSFPTIPLLAHSFQENENLFDVTSDSENFTHAQGGNQVFLYLPEHAGQLAVTRANLPGGVEKRFGGYFGDPLLIVYEVRGSP